MPKVIKGCMELGFESRKSMLPSFFIGGTYFQCLDTSPFFSVGKLGLWLSRMRELSKLSYLLSTLS